MKLKIIAGFYRHRELLKFDNQNLKPTKNIVRCAMFNIFNKNIEGANVLDLFAGSGIIGIEAISRGAKLVYFVDRDLRAINLIQRNLTKLKINNFKVIHDVYEQALKKISQDQIKFNLIVIDPPYGFSIEDYQQILKLIHQNQLLENHAWIMIESSQLLDVSKEQWAFNYHFKIKKYGRTFLTILWKNIKYVV